MNILNLTQHAATPDQIDQGVVDLPAEKKAALKALLTFEELPSKQEIERRAYAIADLAVISVLCGCDGRVMIGGAPYLMSALEAELLDLSIEPVYAFSKRESIEEVDGGTVIKKTVFKHAGFITLL